jgi:RHS repeat-associated protein
MAGRLTSINDFNGNSVQLSYNSFGVLTQVVDSAGGTYAFNSNPNTMLLTNVTFNSWKINFGYDATNRLVSKTITNTSGIYTGVNTTWQFQYGANGLLSQIIDPRGNTGTSVQYDQYGRMTNEMDALGRATTTFYDTPSFLQLTRIDPGTNTWLETYDRKGNMLAQADPLGNTTSYTYDTNADRISIARPLGWTSAFSYDNRANIIASTNALGLVSQWTMDAFFNKAVQAVNPTGWTNAYSLNETNGNLLMHSDAIGALVNYTYATNGLVLSSTDANGHTTSFSYDTNGFLISKTDPATNVTRYTYNDVGWKLSEINALNQVTTYAYDLNGNIVQTVDPLNRTYTKTYDANGNLLSASDAKGQLTTFGYDAANQKIAMTNRAGFAWIYAYNSRGSLQSTTDPLGDTVSRTYDAANRLVAVTAPLGNTVSNIYDADGNVTTTIDQLGQRWSKTYDRLDRVVASSDPRGDVTTTTFDADGRVSEITSPNGYPTTHSYDGRGRLIKWVDAQNFQWLYSYDGVGNITNITDALGGHYIMAYGLRNERLFEQNQDSNIWHYAYDPLLRLQQKTDPNGIIRTYSYDAGSRVTEVDYSTERVDAFTYDLNNNPVIMSRSGSGPATLNQLSYDSMDRVVGDTDTFGNTVGYGYDAVGRRATLTYPGGKILTYNYDALNRLTNQVDWSGRQMNYTYDKVGRLLTRTYPNNIVQSNAFDNAGRITALNYSLLDAQPSTNNYASIALTYAYDLNGNKTGSTEQGTLDWPMPSLHNESSSYTPAGKLTTRTDALSATNNFTYQYDSSGNMTNAVSVGQSYALTYDEDNRTMSIQWQLGAMMDETISNRYDVLGRRVSETAAGIETRYALDLGGGMERVLCDMNSSIITAWYVHGPDLCYKVDATNSLTCYHADAMGNVIALTDVNTNLISEYAYTPYGRNLSSTNYPAAPSNPYLFVGSQGVMEDLPDLYFMHARYYSADASAFLSTDPVRHIGPEWMPVTYTYAGDNPMSLFDINGMDSQPAGEFSYSPNFNAMFNQPSTETGTSWEDFQAWGAFGAGYYYESESEIQTTFNTTSWTYPAHVISSQVPTTPSNPTQAKQTVFATYTRSGLGVGLGASFSEAFSETEPFTPGNESFIGTGDADVGPIGVGGQGALSWAPGQSPLSQGSTSFSISIGPAKSNVGLSVGTGPQIGLNLGLGGAGFLVSSSSGGSGGVGAAQSAIPSHTITAAAVAIGANSMQSTPPASTSSIVGTTTTTTTTSSSSGGGAFATTTTVVQSTATSGNQVTQAIQQAVNTASTAVQNAVHTVVQSVSSFLSSIHL